jgi:hypothetical protein
MGGVGLDCRRRHPSRLGSGDALDFWRVLEAEEPRRLRLAGLGALASRGRSWPGLVGWDGGAGPGVRQGRRMKI